MPVSADLARELVAIMTGCGEAVHEALLATDTRRLAEVVGMGADGEHTKGVDQAAEAAAINFLTTAPVQMNILSEELGFIDRASALTAVIDPIDSTNNATALPNFIQPEARSHPEEATRRNPHILGYPYFAFSIGIFEQGQPIGGAVRNLPTGETFTVIVGQPVELDGMPVTSSHLTASANARVALVRPETTTALRAIEPLLVSSRRVRIAGCSALDLALVACGVLDAVVNPNRVSPKGYGEKIVDFAGGWPMVLQSGGLLTHNDGSPLPSRLDLVDRTPILAAATPALHADLVALIDGVDWDEVRSGINGSV